MVRLHSTYHLLIRQGAWNNTSTYLYLFACFLIGQNIEDLNLQQDLNLSKRNVQRIY